MHKQILNLKNCKAKTINERDMLRCLPCSGERLVSTKLRDGGPSRDSYHSSSRSKATLGPKQSPCWGCGRGTTMAQLTLAHWWTIHHQRRTTPSTRFNDDVATRKPSKRVWERGSPWWGDGLAAVAWCSRSSASSRWLATAWRGSTTAGEPYKGEASCWNMALRWGTQGEGLTEVVLRCWASVPVPWDCHTRFLRPKPDAHRM
jgi:hypothetical protein